VDITVYLPDEIGARAKEADLPFSRLLRAAVEEELNRREAVVETLTDSSEYEVLNLEDNEGRLYTGRLVGTMIAEGRNDVFVYLTDDERVLVHDNRHSKVHEIEDEEAELREWLEEEQYVEAMNALGLQPVVDL